MFISADVFTWFLFKVQRYALYLLTYSQTLCLIWLILQVFFMSWSLFHNAIIFFILMHDIFYKDDLT